jgi:hypothetical protein
MRVGKIARLPHAVREELNRRLLEGEEGKGLVEWLNGREDVQAVLKSEFHGRPINEVNLSAWAQGGYEDWRRGQEALDAATRFVEETKEIQELTADQGLSARVGTMAALALGQLLVETRGMAEGEDRRGAVLKIVNGLVRLRKVEAAVAEAAEAREQD